MKRTIRAILACGIVASAVLGVPNAALASDGRGATPQAEIAAAFQHATGRPPSDAEWQQYSTLPAADCGWGVLDSSYRILTSDAARKTWSNDAQDEAGMLYAALLDRAPEPTGLQTSVQSINTRGLEWTTTEMMASAEYQQRLERICDGRSTTYAAQMSWADAREFVDDTILPAAEGVGVICGLDKTVWAGVSKLDKLAAQIPKGDLRRTFASQADTLIKQLDKQAGGSGGKNECKAAVSYLAAAKEIVDIAASDKDTTTGGDNSVFVDVELHKNDDWRPGHTTDFTIRVGPNPTSWEAHTGTVRTYPKLFG